MGDASVFISYRRDDAAGHAGRLHDDLAETFGPEQIFMDLSDIRLGEHFLEQIRQGVRNAVVVIAIIGPSWLEAADVRGRRRLDDPDDFVRLELAEALSHGKPLIPVLVHGARVPSPNELPDALTGLAHAQAIEISDGRWRHDMTRLIEELERRTVAPAPLVSFPEVPAVARVELRAAWLVAGDVSKVKDRLLAFLSLHKMQITEDYGDVFHLRGGSKLKTRVLGVLSVPGTALPKVAKVRISDRGSRVQIEALVREDWGPGVLVPGEDRYRSYFDSWMTDLRRATGDRSV